MQPKSPLTDRIFHDYLLAPQQEATDFYDLLEGNVNPIFTDFLHLYGGSACHDFFLKAHKVFLNLAIKDWNRLVSLPLNPALAKDTLLAFFLFHTSLRNRAAFSQMGLDMELQNRFNKNFYEKPYSELPLALRRHNNRIYKRLGLSDVEILGINTFSFIS